jgi:hypothetical protein
MGQIMTNTEAYTKAKKMARHGHRDWLVWKLPDGTYRAAKLAEEPLKTAMSECVENDQGKPVCVCIQANTAVGVNVSRALADVWLANMQAGTFSY